MAADTKSYIMEFVGTMILCFHISVSSAGSNTTFGMICGYIVLMMMGARISGAHFNPGITLGLVVQGKASGKTFGFYFLMHFLGSLAAAALHLIFIGRYGQVAKAFDWEQMWQLFVLFMTAQIVITVIYMLIAVNPRSPRAAFCFCVPLTQYFVSSFSRFSSYALLGNCSVYLGSILFTQNWGGLISATFGCLAGGAIGGWIYKSQLAD